MIFIEGQEITCKICGRTASLKNDLVLSEVYEANESAPLFQFNQSIVHFECLENHPLKTAFFTRLNEIENLNRSLSSFDFITHEPLDIEHLGHPDNLIKTIYFSDDSHHPLYRFNCISLNKRNLNKWIELSHFKKCLLELNDSNNWKGNAIKFILKQLESPVHQPWSQEFLKQMKERYPDKFI